MLELTAMPRAVLDICAERPLASSDIVSRLGHATLSGNLRKAIRSLRQQGLLEYTIAAKPRDSRQKYRLTKKGTAICPASAKMRRSEIAQITRFFIKMKRQSRWCCIYDLSQRGQIATLKLWNNILG